MSVPARKRSLDLIDILFCALWLALIVWGLLKDGVQAEDCILLGLGLALLATGLLIRRSRRPVRSYLWILSGSLAAGLVVLMPVLTWADARTLDIVLAVVAWLLMTLFAFIWAHHYERTEPLSEN